MNREFLEVMEKKDLFWLILISLISVVIASFAVRIMVKMPPPGPGQNPVQPQNVPFG
jgi:hypothetical protein